MSKKTLYELKNDEAIWSAFKNGSKEAFAALYQRYSKVLMQYGLRIASDRDLVKDCIQDLFVEIWKSKANLVDPKSLKAYLLSSMQRKLIRHLKRIQLRHNDVGQAKTIETAPCVEHFIIEAQLEKEQQILMTTALNTLTKRQKEAVYLKFYVNLTYAEISDMMMISIDAIYNLISKAIDNLQSELTRISENKL